MQFHGKKYHKNSSPFSWMDFKEENEITLILKRFITTTILLIFFFSALTLFYCFLVASEDVKKKWALAGEKF